MMAIDRVDASDHQHHETIDDRCIGTAAATSIMSTTKVVEGVDGDELLPLRRSSHAPPAASSSQTPTSSLKSSAPVTAGAHSRGRIYRTIANDGGTTATWVTRDIASLDFLLGIPMEAERDIVLAGLMQQVPNEELGDRIIIPPVLAATATGRWWEKYVKDPSCATGEVANENDKNELEHEQELERPDTKASKLRVVPSTTHLAAPGRRLDGDDAYRVKIPLSHVLESKTRQRSIARQAAVREWEIRVANGLEFGNPPLLDGRVFFSASGGYPIGVFSVIRYEPKREEAARKRQKLEELGGGGSQFIIPERDWRGTSYRALLPRVKRKNRAFNRLVTQPEDDEETSSDSESDVSTSSDESGVYVPGFLDDPEMVQGRHRHVMLGDRVTGCIVSSTIQFVNPIELKADLNKQFRERFDGWEPPKSKWKFIGAKVIDGIYTLSDPTEEHDERSKESRGGRQRQNSQSSHTSSTVDAKDTIRMPPSLTLSKIRNVKHQALMAAVGFGIEVSTVALACVYFERLCLDTRVDKSNRRLCFAACLMLAAKINEKNVRLDIQTQDDGDEGKIARPHALVKPTNASSTMFASLLEFFAHDWHLSLKTLFAAEWGVFAALGFDLHTTPSQVAFHFKRMMKVLEWSPLSYLGPQMYSQWQDTLDDEELRREAQKKREERRLERKDRKLLQLQRERLQQENDAKQRDSDADTLSEKAPLIDDAEVKDIEGDQPPSPSRASSVVRKMTAMGFLHRLAHKRNADTTNITKFEDRMALTEHNSAYGVPKNRQAGILRSPSLPAIADLVDANTDNVAIDVIDHDDRSIGALSDGGLWY